MWILLSPCLSCSFQGLSHTDVRKFGMLRAYILSFSFTASILCVPVWAISIDLPWISLISSVAMLESVGESADSLHLLPSLPSQHHQLFSLPLYLSAETAHLILYARLVHQHCEFMNQTVHAAPHLVLLIVLSIGNALLSPTFRIAHRICWKPDSRNWRELLVHLDQACLPFVSDFYSVWVI